MKSILRIGEFAKINQIPIRTLRFYDQIGLLKPYQVDPQTNYRLYHIEQSSIVDTIQYLRKLDFSLKDIKEILSDKERIHIHSLIEEKYLTLLEEKAQIDKQLHEIEIFRSGALLYQEKVGHTKDIEILTLPKRSIYSFTIDQDIYQMTESDYEAHLRYFKQELLNYNPFFEHFGRVGSIIHKQDFQRADFHSNQFSLLVNEPLHHKDLIKSVLPQGQYASLYCSSLKEEIQLLPNFLQAILDAGYTIVGDYICEVIHEQPNLTSQKRDMFIRMQVQIGT